MVPAVNMAIIAAVSETHRLAKYPLIMARALVRVRERERRNCNISIFSRDSFFSMAGRILVIVTGANRGFGRSAAKQLHAQYAKTHTVDYVLTARDMTGLQETCDILAGPGGKPVLLIGALFNTHSARHLINANLSEIATLQDTVNEIFSKVFFSSSQSHNTKQSRNTTVVDGR